MTSNQKQFRRKLAGFGVLLIFFIFAVVCFGVVKAVASPPNATVQQAVDQPSTDGTAQKETDPGVVRFAFLAAAIAVGVGSLGAGAAVGYVGAAAMGAIGEKPELAGRALIFVGLAEGIAIYGLIIAIMILGKV